MPRRRKNFNRTGNLSKYFFSIILLFFISLLSFNLVRTYGRYVSIKSQINKISSLVNNQKKQNNTLKKEYAYYSSNYYKNNIATNDLNLYKKNSSEIVLPKNPPSSYINLPSQSKSKKTTQKTSLIEWINLLF